MDRQKPPGMSRRDLLRLGGAAVVGAGALREFPAWALPAPRASMAQQTPACGATQGVIEAFPTSPLILDPWTDSVPIPQPLKPTPASECATWSSTPAPWSGGVNDCDGVVHQLGPSDIIYNKAPLPAPIIYRIELKVRPHRFTGGRLQSLVDYVDQAGNLVPAGTIYPSQPDCTIYGFNGTFPGPMINAEYGKPACVRFINKLDDNPYNLDRQDYGDPDHHFLTHLHNGHTACESDGNPNHKAGAYGPDGGWVDNLYLNWPAGGDDREKQSFMWFHDHRMDHTGANVYKGMVGLYPIYDLDNNKDMGDERKGYRLPGVRTNIGYPDGTSTFKVDYDIPLALYDCRLDDGAVPHQDFHNGCGETHPEWFGKGFFRHFPNHGFVGDVFTVNGKAYPVLTVKRRRYRLRFLDASIARIYRLQLMNGNNGYESRAFPGQLGQYNLGQVDGGGTFVRGGQQCMKFVQVASEGGLLPYPILRDSIEVWPAKRREVIIDFSKYMDGSPTRKGEVIYLTNVLQMSTGRKPDTGLMLDATGNPTNDPSLAVETEPTPDPTYAVPILKIVIGDDAPDNSFDPLAYANGTCSLKLDPTTKLPLLKLRPAPQVPRSWKGLDTQHFELQRSGTVGGETQWLINGQPFQPTVPLAYPVKDSAALWVLKNGGGGWVHPMHLHMEEHHVISRNGVLSPQISSASGTGSLIDYSRTYGSVSNPDPGDNAKEDVIALAPGEEVVVYRQFRTFKGPYVAHCHNLAHEDHAMMFGWNIV